VTEPVAPVAWLAQWSCASMQSEIRAPVKLKGLSHSLEPQKPQNYE
jgi:hypothetical protein